MEVPTLSERQYFFIIAYTGWLIVPGVKSTD